MIMTEEIKKHEKGFSNTRSILNKHEEQRKKQE